MVVERNVQRVFKTRSVLIRKKDQQKIVCEIKISSGEQSRKIPGSKNRQGEKCLEQNLEKSR